MTNKEIKELFQRANKHSQNISDKLAFEALEKEFGDKSPSAEILTPLIKQIQDNQIKITVWTNGKGIRKYTGQDTVQEKYPNHGYKHPKDNGWYKATAIIIKEEQ